VLINKEKEILDYFIECLNLGFENLNEKQIDYVTKYANLIIYRTENLKRANSIMNSIKLDLENK
jgi:hypothetical protein